MNNLDETNKYDIILIGDSLTLYMASIYLQTSNYKQLIITIPEKDNLNFNGFDKVAGVENVIDQSDLLQRCREQTKNLDVCLLNENIQSIYLDKENVIKMDKFEVKTERNIYYSKCLVCNTNEITLDGLFNTNKNVIFNEAIELLGNGCKLSFDVREYFSKYGAVSKNKANRSFSLNLIN